MHIEYSVASQFHFFVELFQSCIGKCSKEFCVYVKRESKSKKIVLDRGEKLRKYIELMELVSNDKQTHSHFTYIEFQCKNCNVEIVSTPLSAATPQNDLQCSNFGIYFLPFSTYFSNSISCGIGIICIIYEL